LEEVAVAVVRRVSGYAAPWLVVMFSTNKPLNTRDLAGECSASLKHLLKGKETSKKVCW
jgi:hypothetical protein